MRVTYSIDMEIEPSEYTDLISIMDNLSNAIERAAEWYDNRFR